MSEFERNVKELTVLLREITEEPSTLDGMSHVEQAWLLEHLELLRQESGRLLAEINQVIADREQE